MRLETAYRKWSDYPIGTKAFAFGGGHWTKVKHGWKWCTGDTFPTPGGDATGEVELPSFTAHNDAQAAIEEAKNG